MSRQARLFPHEQALAAAVAAQLASVMATELDGRDRCDVALTGGGVGTLVLSELVQASEGLDWSGVHLWWSDERYLPAGDHDRNEVQARSALTSLVPIPVANLHPMPPDDGQSVETAAAAYAAELASVRPESRLPDFAVALLGIGPDGHVASLFPDHPALREHASSTVAVTGSPKPPPVRVSFTLDSINSARQVWVLASGSAKASAIARAWSSPADAEQCPASAVHGTQATVFWMDQDAASGVPD